MGLAARQEDRARIAEVFRTAPDVAQVLDTYTIQFSPKEVILAAHLQLRSDLGPEAVGDVLDRLETRLAEAVPTLSQIFLEVEDPSSFRRKRRTHQPY